MTRQINQAGLDLIKRFEGCRLTAYQDSIGVWTIGVGHTKGVHAGEAITQEQADEFLREDLSVAEDSVSTLAHSQLNDNQFAACVSLVFNIGAGNFSHSSLLKFLNEGNFDLAADEFHKWANAGGHVLPGLIARRNAEADLFRKMVLA